MHVRGQNLNMLNESICISFQHIVSIIRRKWKSYASDWWNRLDWLSIIVYASGMLLKLWQGYQFRNASKILLVAAFILLSIRILNLCCMSAILGPKLVMIRKMVCFTIYNGISNYLLDTLTKKNVFIFYCFYCILTFQSGQYCSPHTITISVLA